MVDLDELWIGDTVKLLASNRIGKYDGQINGKARININGKIVLTAPSNLSIHEEKESPYIDLDLSTGTSTTVEPPNTEIDLHIDKLNPNMLNALPERIRDYQIGAAKTFIEQAIQHKLSSIEIIHGKGKGVLKAEVHHLLSLYDEVKFHVMGRDGGSTEVWFR